MSIYMSRAELEEISEGLITAYANKFSKQKKLQRGKNYSVCVKLRKLE